MFQGFYAKASELISAHIRALSTRQSRDGSATVLASSKRSNPTKDGKRLRSISARETPDALDRTAPEQQMLTPLEISNRRKARRLLEQKGVALEELVEKRVCERLYSRIWRHRSTLDEVRDEKLRSRTAALALVGIGLQDLGVRFEENSKSGESAIQREGLVQKYISTARDGLLQMNDARSPLGKLEHLAAAHKSIVDLLTTLHQSSSSADEILPTLIYTLITTPPEGINVISNLHFTQRFRAATRVDGEAAYCLTNLEAAITFLETVDLASLRSNESPEGPSKYSSRPSTPKDDGVHSIVEKQTPSESFLANAITPAVLTPASPDQITVSQSPETGHPPKPISPSYPRRSSNLFQPPIDALGAASDAVRTTADQGFKNISNSLDNSFKFLFGRLKEHKLSQDDGNASNGVIVPRTLDEARKLVDPQPFMEEEGEYSGASLTTDHLEASPISHMKIEDKILGLFSHRDRSVDSVHSSGSGKRVAFSAEAPRTKENAGSSSHQSAIGVSPSIPPSAQHELTHMGNAAVESMRNLGNSLNPLNRFASMSVMRGFGRSSAVTPLSSSTAERSVAEGLESHGQDHVAAMVSGAMAPPIQRFLAMSDASELKVGEIDELLKDYQRLARALLR